MLEYLFIFLQFFESQTTLIVYENKKNQISNSKLIVNTLLELYIKRISEGETLGSPTTAAAVASATKTIDKPMSIHEKKALEFLASNLAAYDMNLALAVCQLNNFKAGLLFLYEKNAMYQRILQYYMDHNDYPNILETCKKHGIKDMSLWILSLQYFSKREEYNCKEYIMQILTNIESFNLLTPLMVIKILSENSTLTIDTVKVRNLEIYLSNLKIF